MNKDIERCKFKINNNIHALNIDYLWEELNCRSRPIATSFYAFNYDFLELILFWESFSNLYLLDFSPSLLDNSFTDFYSNNLSKIFGLDLHLKHTKYIDEDNFHKAITQNIDNNVVVILPVDMYMMPYAPDYIKTHHMHFIVMKGYDLDREIYYVLDNMQLENGATRYENFKIRFDDIYKMHKCFFDYFLDEQMGCYFLLQKKYNSKNYFLESLRLLEEKIKSIDWVESSIEMKICNCLNKQIDFPLYKAVTLMNMRKVYYGSFKKMLEKINADASIIREYEQKSFDFDSRWKAIKNKVIYEYEKKEKDLEKIRKLIIESINSEFLYLAELLREIISKTKDENVSCTSNIIIINNNSAPFSIGDKRICVTHENTKRYDTWLIQDDAFQILTFVEDEKEFLCEVKASTKTNSFESPFNFGLMVRYSDNTKLLFGNETNQSIAIYHPLNEEKYKVAVKKYIFPPCFLRIIKNDDKLSFYVSKNEGAMWEKIDEYQYDQKITHVGLFSSTDDYIEHNTLFEDFKLISNNEEITMDSLTGFLNSIGIR